MCGIIGYVGTRDVVPVLIGGLKKLEYRGYDSAGIAVVNGSGPANAVTVVRAEGKLSNLEGKLSEKALHGTFGMGHTRWATHGKPNENNAHPHRDCTANVVDDPDAPRAAAMRLGVGLVRPAVRRPARVTHPAHAGNRMLIQLGF